MSDDRNSVSSKNSVFIYHLLSTCPSNTSLCDDKHKGDQFLTHQHADFSQRLWPKQASRVLPSASLDPLMSLFLLATPFQVPSVSKHENIPRKEISSCPSPVAKVLTSAPRISLFLRSNSKHFLEAKLKDLFCKSLLL